MTATDGYTTPTLSSWDDVCKRADFRTLLSLPRGRGILALATVYFDSRCSVNPSVRVGVERGRWGARAKFNAVGRGVASDGGVVGSTLECHPAAFVAAADGATALAIRSG
jgi:hypothetical protein